MPIGEFDLFSGQVNAYIEDSTLIFMNQNLYPRGILTVTVSVAHEFTADQIAYTSEFSIRIVDCSEKEDYLEFKNGKNPNCESNKPPSVVDEIKEVVVSAN